MTSIDDARRASQAGNDGLVSALRAYQALTNAEAAEAHAAAEAARIAARFQQHRETEIRMDAAWVGSVLTAPAAPSTPAAAPAAPVTPAVPARPARPVAAPAAPARVVTTPAGSFGPAPAAPAPARPVAAPATPARPTTQVRRPLSWGWVAIIALAAMLVGWVLIAVIANDVVAATVMSPFLGLAAGFGARWWSKRN